MPRGLLGRPLAEIPLYGPVRDLKKRLRCKDPFTE